ncbi:hypothetical protein Droror1_Dr00028269 [Drosera rotundifolia]
MAAHSHCDTTPTTTHSHRDTKRLDEARLGARGDFRRDYRGGRVVRLEFSWFREEMLEVSTLFEGVLFVVHIRSGLKVAWGWFSLDFVSCVVMP